MENHRLSGEKQLNIALSLSGGAARGAFHLGVLEAFEKTGIVVKAISGSSIGAIIATSYASGVSPREQLEIFKSKAFKKSFKFNYFKNGLFSVDKKRDVLKQLAPIDDISNTDIKLHITAVDLISGDIKRFDKGDPITLCLASSALVPIFEPISYHDMELVDGGVLDNMPVQPLKQYDLPIFGVDLHPEQKGYKNTVTGIIKRTIFIAWRASVLRNKKDCNLYITHPDLRKFSLFSFKKLDDMYKLGLETGLKLTEY